MLSFRSQVLMPALLFVLALGVFLPTVTYDFVNWDDPWYVTHNPLIKSWSPSNLLDIATQPVARNFAPLTQLSLLIDYSFWNLDPAGYHLTNALLHAANVVLVFFLLRALTGSYFVAWTTALLFAVHPVQIETVAWVSSRKSLLSATFMLASLLCWLRTDRTIRHERWGMVWLFAALLTKAIAVMVPPIVLAYDVLVRGQRFRDSLARQAIPGLAAAWLVLMTMSAQTTIVGGTREHFHLGKLQILALDTALLWKYVGMLLVPTNLSVMYDVPTRGMGLAMAWSIIGWLAVAWFAWTQKRSRPLVSFAICVFVALFLPVLNLFPLTTLMNDRYLYLPSIAAFGIAAAIMQQVGGWAGKYSAGVDAPLVRPNSDRAYWIGRGVQAAIAGAAMTACIVLTSRHLPVWENGYALWSYTVKQSPRLTVVQFQWAQTLHDEGRTGEAITVLKNALTTCTPDDIDRKRIHDTISEWSGAQQQVAIDQ